MQIYTTSLNKLYDKEVKEFMESVKTNMATRTDRKGNLDVFIDSQQNVKCPLNTTAICLLFLRSSH